MSENYIVEQHAYEEDDVWDADIWEWLVKRDDEIICICASEEEAKHIAKLLNADPII